MPCRTRIHSDGLSLHIDRFHSGGRRQTGQRRELRKRGRPRPAKTVIIAIIVAVAVIEAGHPMANLLVRNVDDEISRALKARASAHGVSAEAEHRRILEEALLRPKPRSFLRVLADMPDVGRDEDFARRQDETARPIFD